MFYCQHLCETQNYWFIFFTVTLGYLSLSFWIPVGATHLLCDMYEHLNSFFLNVENMALKAFLIFLTSQLYCYRLLIAFKKKKRKSIFTVFGTFLKCFTMFCIVCESKYVIEFSLCLRSVGLFIVCYINYKVYVFVKPFDIVSLQSVDSRSVKSQLSI